MIKVALRMGSPDSQAATENVDHALILLQNFGVRGSQSGKCLTLAQVAMGKMVERLLSLKSLATLLQKEISQSLHLPVRGMKNIAPGFLFSQNLRSLLQSHLKRIIKLSRYRILLLPCPTRFPTLRTSQQACH